MVLNLEKIIKLSTPDNYMEHEGHDTRIAVGKFLSFEQTLRHANLALVYANEKEYDSKEKLHSFIKSVYIRHAILELNNSYDLLLQVPWFYYRIWESYNLGGALRDKKNKNDITRNSNKWVATAEKRCDEKKVRKYLLNHTDTAIKSLESEIKDFKDNYIFNANKPFTIRTLANQMKHNNTIVFDELREKVEKFNVKIGDTTIDLKKENQSFCITNYATEQANPNEVVYCIVNNMNETVDNFKNEYLVDINYINGEEFKAIDYLRLDTIVSLKDVYNEAIEYGNKLIDLYEEFYKVIAPNFDSLPTLSGPVTVNKVAESNIDEYFK
ncbi:hypothetical protein GCM10007425_30720 [Lysinibacillus alkalisoli]|uniref:Uncharacterized protein n=1 Tax=Lysinibacillus alkalisoli TaxID=1911548 RepID=A0A917GAX4_9BACI|nr:hypothetical protein [Lysinibacillus alkalisoli]GGG33865.1 hypothetical protein GCM10007425_30720 [Lysinibacillus alkalisoli]